MHTYSNIYNSTTERKVSALFNNLIASDSYQRAADPYILGSDDADDRCTIVMPAGGTVVGSDLIVTESAYELSINNTTKWDSYVDAATRAGSDFYLWMTPAGTVLISASSITPTGYTYGTCRKIGGFHCLCADVGTITNHSLTGFLAGDILPMSIWDQVNRPTCSPEGMVRHPLLPWWCDIYLQSGTGKDSGSFFGENFTATRNWMDFTDDLAAVGKQMLSDQLFATFASGSNEKTNIVGSANPVTGGGHVDTANRRMVSDVGVEDACGVIYQWIDEQRGQIRGLPDTGDPAFAYYTLPGNKGSMYIQGNNDVALLASGLWNSGAYCGSRCWNANNARWSANSSIGCRGCARSRQGINS